jgi:hypothetical protein
MGSQWSLTVVEYDENDKPQHETLAECDSRFHFLQAVQRHADIAHKCYVTVTDFGTEGDFDGSGVIVEQTNAQEWLEEEMQRYAV